VHSAIFVSPHFDDICFSLAHTLPRMRLGHKTLINIFTRSDDVSNRDALKRLEGLKGKERIDTISRLRNEEDDAFAGKLGFEKINLDFEDADVVAGTEREPGKHYGGIELEIQLVIERLAPLLRELAERERDPVILAPLAVGKHRNHLGTFEAVVAIGKTLPPHALVFYEELPYAAAPAARDERLTELRPFLKRHRYERHPVPLDWDDLDRKCAEALKYQSQMDPSNEHFVIRTAGCREMHEALWVSGEAGSFASLFG
jgi:LmbE family N-acetylglucosaminyl deacetylase